MFIDYLKYGYSNYLWTIALFILLFFYSKNIIGFYRDKDREKSNILNFINVFTSIFLLFGCCYFVYLEINNFKAVSKGYKEFTGVYIGIKDLNDYPNARTSQYELEFKDDDGNTLKVRYSYIMYNRFKHLEPLKIYNVKYFKDDLIREIELLE